eukprot:snap_masked-scaffold_38-processed-gene-0.10-mRNA-1 protein AED:1.00 eAED:1.00 QI:0/0/0/0/1/1/3/0/64
MYKIWEEKLEVLFPATSRMGFEKAPRLVFSLTVLAYRDFGLWLIVAIQVEESLTFCSCSNSCII